MAKDDYIKFRCSTEFKKMVDDRAKELGMNVSNYMETLIRKDVEDMMYVIDLEGLSKNIVKKIIENGLAVKLGDYYLLSKNENITINKTTIKAISTLEDFFENFHGGEDITLVGELRVSKSDAIESLIAELNQPHNDNGETYAELIYNSENPYEEIKKLINEFLLLRIDFIKTDIDIRIRQIEEAIQNDSLKWE